MIKQQAVKYETIFSSGTVHKDIKVKRIHATTFFLYLPCRVQRLKYFYLLNISTDVPYQIQ